MKQKQRLLSKLSFYATTFCLFLVNVFLVYSRFTRDLRHNDRTSITITETNDKCILEASFNVNKTGKVQEYINKFLAPHRLFSSENDNFDVITTLADKTEFHLKESPGKLEIEFDKMRNSTSSYYRIKNMFDGVKNIIGSK